MENSKDIRQSVKSKLGLIGQIKKCSRAKIGAGKHCDSKQCIRANKCPFAYSNDRYSIDNL